MLYDNILLSLYVIYGTFKPIRTMEPTISDLASSLRLIQDDLSQIKHQLSTGERHDEPPYLAQEACDILRINRRTLERKIKAGKIKAVTRDKVVYIHRAELRRYLSSSPQADQFQK